MHDALTDGGMQTGFGKNAIKRFPGMALENGKFLRRKRDDEGKGGASTVAVRR
jgi:hypothetical protein